MEKAPVMYTAVFFNSMDLPLDRVDSVDISEIQHKLKEWARDLQDGDYIQFAVS